MHPELFGNPTAARAGSDLEMEVYVCKVILPTLVAGGQSEGLIISTNLLRNLTRLKVQKGLQDSVVTAPYGECGS